MQPNHTMTRRSAIIIGLFVACLLLGSLVWASMYKQQAKKSRASNTQIHLLSNGQSGTTTNGYASTTPAQKNIPISPNRKTTNQGSSDYQYKLAEFANRRIQFDDCVALPTNVTYTNKTNVMLDNRSADPITVTINGHEYPIKAYGYSTVLLQHSSVPRTLYVHCVLKGKTTYNVSMIKLQ